MARTITQIQNAIIASKNADTNLSGLTSTSQTAVWLAWSFIVAVAINLFEQLLDVFKTEIEASLPAVALGNEAWIQDKVLNLFQYDATTAQVLVCDKTTNFVPSYAVIDATKRLCTRCSVLTIPFPNKTVEIKVAKSEPPAPLDGSTGTGGLEASALIAFLKEILPAGVTYNVTNEDADRLYIGGTIYFNGAYNTTILVSVRSAISSYLAGIDFNGKIKYSDLEKAIKAVVGVTDVDLTLVQARRNTGAIGQNIIYNLSGGVNNLIYQMFSGYAIEEDTTGQTWTDTLIFTAN